MLVIGRHATKPVRDEAQVAADYRKPVLVFCKDIAERQPETEELLRMLDQWLQRRGRTRSHGVARDFYGRGRPPGSPLSRNCSEQRPDACGHRHRQCTPERDSYRAHRHARAARACSQTA
jgi:hypothetical protein